MTVLRLEPETAVQSIKRRLETIEQNKAWIKATVGRYDGLNAFDNLLVENKIMAAVTALMAEGK